MAQFKSVVKWSAPAIAMGLAMVPLAQIYAQDAPVGDPASGKQVFEGAMCGACHVLAAADASGPIGPSLDHNPNLSQAFIVDVVSHGSGAMPPYSGQFSEAEINDVAAYILSAVAKAE